MGKELNKIGYVYELVHFYSRGADNTDVAMKAIIEKRKILAEERKEIRANLKAYKPIISIYEEMKKYMLRAYLFDSYGRTEYIDDFKKYSELSDKLMKIYGKSVEEVADYIADQKAQLLYAKAQDVELNEQYKVIKQYVDEKKFIVDEKGLSFFKAVGHSEAKRNAREYGIYVSHIKYITAKDMEDIIVRVITTPDVVDGKNTVTTTVTVMTNDEKSIKEVSSRNMDAKAFNDALFELSSEYGLRDCQAHRKNIRKNVL